MQARGPRTPAATCTTLDHVELFLIEGATQARGLPAAVEGEQ
jgi:hypothetical protein